MNMGRFRFGFFSIGMVWLLVSFWPIQASVTGKISLQSTAEVAATTVEADTIPAAPALSVKEDWFATLYYKDTLIPPPFMGMGASWVDSVYASLSMEEKIGQLLMVAAYSNKNEQHYREIDRFVSEYKVGDSSLCRVRPTCRHASTIATRPRPGCR